MMNPIEQNQEQEEKKALSWHSYVWLILISVLIISLLIFYKIESPRQEESRVQEESQIAESPSYDPADNPLNTLKSEVAGFTEPARPAEYKLIESEGSGTFIQYDELLQNGSYYKQKSGGSVYVMFNRDECIENSPYELKRIEEIDPDKLQVYRRDGRYARDSENVYFNEPTGYWGCENHHKFNVLEAADPNTFDPAIVTRFPISQGNGFQGLYSRDSRYVFYGSDLLEGVDVGTFALSENVSIASDKNHVYLWNEILPGADPSSYLIVLDESSAGRGTVYGKDRDHAFVDYCILTDVDPVTFSIGPWDPNLGNRFQDKSGEFKIELDAGGCRVIR